MSTTALKGNYREPTATGLSNTWLAILFFIAVEIVLFASFIYSFQ